MISVPAIRHVSPDCRVAVTTIGSAALPASASCGACKTIPVTGIINNIKAIHVLK